MSEDSTVGQSGPQTSETQPVEAVGVDPVPQTADTNPSPAPQDIAAHAGVASAEDPAPPKAEPEAVAPRSFVERESKALADLRTHNKELLQEVKGLRAQIDRQNMTMERLAQPAGSQPPGSLVLTPGEVVTTQEAEAVTAWVRFAVALNEHSLKLEEMVHSYANDTTISRNLLSDSVKETARELNIPARADYSPAKGQQARYELRAAVKNASSLGELARTAFRFVSMFGLV